VTIRILLADDHGMVRDALQRMLQAEHDIEVVGVTGDGREAVELARTLTPDVVVMDVAMPELNGIEATARIVARDPNIKVVGISTYSDKRFVLQMLRAGAMGYIAKTSAATELIRAIRAVVRGQRYLCPNTAAAVMDTLVHSSDAAKATNPALSRREREVLQLVAEGLRTIDIAERMHVAEATVEVHRRNIMRKLELHSVAELTKYAIREGLTTL
jgi:DNA-binding NarL/FixJ family response regulator